MPLFDFKSYDKPEEYSDEAALRISFAEAEPVLSATNLNYHYTILYSNYIDKAKDDSADEFAIAGAFLHQKYFSQMQPTNAMGSPDGKAKDFINLYFNNYLQFKQEFITKAMSIKGSGWCYLTTSGTIEVIENHKFVGDVALIVDMWEHAYYTDYGPDKESYLNNIWKLIDWSVISDRIK